MIKKKSLLSELFVFFLMLQIVLYFFNTDEYYQVSGSYLFLVVAFGLGLLEVFNHFNGRSLCGEYIIPTAILLVSLLISVICNIDRIESGYAISYLLMVCFLFLFMMMDVDQSQIKKIEKAYLAYAIIVSLLIIFLQTRYYADESTRITIKIGSNPLIDPNYLAASLVAPALIAFRNIYPKMNSLKKIGVLMVFAIIMLGVFFTGSRGSFVAIGVGAAWIFWKNTLQKAKTEKWLRLILLGILLVLLLLWILPPESVARLFDVGSWNDNSNNRRFELWHNAIQAIAKRPFEGYGMYPTALLIEHPAHNTFLEIWVQLGVLGILPILFIFAKLVFSKNSAYVKALCLATVVFSFFISAETLFFFWLNMALCMKISVMDKKAKESGYAVQG